ncbi:hypothetical protein PV327_004011 [Microctonus hyperodae]|uniref:Uncharacterized protein n=1 Tax=Microctonus hyperodae TaxID=165561 RepID=A0AA39G561_MICHY|nr:hypothetical protein PV327_004011 [Microctonus hyperodae]
MRYGYSHESEGSNKREDEEVGSIRDESQTFILLYGCTPGNKSDILASQMLTEEEFQEHSTINWDAILWVRRPLELWVVQVILAMVSLTEALLLAYLGYKLLRGKRLAAVTIIPLHFGIGQYNTVHHNNTLPSNAQSLYTSFFELLAGKALAGKYVQRLAQGNAEISIGLESTADDTQRNITVPCLHQFGKAYNTPHNSK